ncbi:MAG: HAMP domain-containing histidine kinase [Chitinophagaceae bacterium]|nr:HAMP domain-containing histidine kinase [Chitinophagaceae bacterium]
MKNIYHFFSGIRWLASNYTMKFLFIAFLGVHIPLIALIIAITFNWLSLSPWSIILLALLATLLATGMTLLLLRGLLWPILEAHNALANFTEKGKLPALPKHYSDEAGRLLQQVQVSIESIDTLMRERKDMITLLSHDLRSPLNQVSSIGELLAQETSAEKARHYGTLLNKIASEQLHFLQDMLHLMQLDEADRIPDTYERKSIAPLLQQVVAAQADAARAKNIRITVTDIPDITVRYHGKLLSQALQNLLVNAIKFSHPNTTILFRTQIFSGHVHIQVVDQGIGFPPAIAERLFQKFTPESRPGIGGEKSAGIGLFITRKIIQNHGGIIAAFSDGDGKGAVFTIQLPLSGGD